LGPWGVVCKVLERHFMFGSSRSIVFSARPLGQSLLVQFPSAYSQLHLLCRGLGVLGVVQANSSHSHACLAKPAPAQRRAHHRIVCGAAGHTPSLTCAHTHLHTHAHTYTQTCTQTHTSVHTHTHTSTHTNTHTHTNIHTLHVQYTLYKQCVMGFINYSALLTMLPHLPCNVWQISTTLQTILRIKLILTFLPATVNCQTNQLVSGAQTLPKLLLSKIPKS